MASAMRSRRADSLSSMAAPYRMVVTIVASAPGWACGQCYDRRGLLPLRRAPAAILLFLSLVLLTACGIKFGGAPEETEFFKEMRLNGEMLANREISVELEVEDPYEVPVRVACYYENPDKLTKDQKKVAFEERAQLVGERVLEPAPSAGSGSTRKLTFRFSVPEPGTYTLACLTPAAPDNAIARTFRIAAPADGAA
jgi:hypothetical protein